VAVMKPAPTAHNLVEVDMAEETSRRGMLFAGAGLGALGLGTALTAPYEAAAKAAEITMPPASEAVAKFRLTVPAAALNDLRARLPQPAGRRKRRSTTGPKACPWRR
jgi:predicted RNA methylase